MNYLLFIAICFLTHEVPDSLPVIQAYDAEESSLLSFDSFRTRYGESWLISASPSMPCADCDSFHLDNIFDGDLATAWISAAEDAQASEYICVQSPLAPDPENEQYFYFTDIWGDEDRITKDIFCVSSFYIYNGWQKSPDTWREYSRIKRILVWNNDRMYCVIELEDTMCPQIVDILRFVIDNPERWHINMPYGDRLKFEIIDVYPGDTYQNIGVSELLIGWSAG